jgi:regulator of PEP synthase PpsR (kinase-PPPase family)
LDTRVYIVSGGVGASGEQLVHTVLAQFPGKQVTVITFGNVRQPEQIQNIIHQAKETHGIIVHTLVESRLRNLQVEMAQTLQVPAIDLMGELITWLEDALVQKPSEQPGLYRKLRQDYFDRVGAIEFTMAHDDAKNPEDLDKAEIVIAGVSRAGKTPLSLYLSVLGWKVANVPIIQGVEPPAELFLIDPRRVIGLTIEPGQLLAHRQQRQRRIGAPGPTLYTDPQAIYDEIEHALRLFKSYNFSVIDVTDKPIETSADEIIRLITRQTEMTTTRTGEG